MNQLVPQYWDAKEAMPNVGSLRDTWLAKQKGDYFSVPSGVSFMEGAEAMWEKLKADGRIDV